MTTKTGEEHEDHGVRGRLHALAEHEEHGVREALHALTHHDGAPEAHHDGAPRAHHAAEEADDAHPVRRHVQALTHRYLMHFPPHPARQDDPHYADFDHYHRKTRKTARCYIGERVGYGDCLDAKGTPCPPPADGGEQPGLELHHSHIEFSLQNGISLKALEKDYPGISNRSAVGDWIESADNLRWLCAYHHRGAGGAHTASHADYEASQYIFGLIKPATDK